MAAMAPVLAASLARRDRDVNPSHVRGRDAGSVLAAGRL